MSATARAQSWPAGLDQRPTHPISEVLDALQGEFPMLTVSKLRYLEDQGLVCPERTQSGYRRYSEADVERVAWVLTQQRDHFLPLKVIRERLAAMDAARREGIPVPWRKPPTAVPAADVATVTGQDQALVEAVAQAAGVANPKVADAALVQAVEAVAELRTWGLELRHLRPVFQAARRQADLVAVATAAQRGPGSAAAQAAVAAASECADAVARLDAALLRLALAET